MENFLSQLESAVWERAGRREGVEVRFLCPVHDDTSPSARWHLEKHVWYCDVCGKGGGAVDLVRRLGITLPDFEQPGLTLEELAGAKSLPVEFLRSLGVREGVNGTERTRCVETPYLDEHGDAGPVRKRLSLNGNPRFIWRRGDKPTAYGLWRLASSLQTVLVEGESDSWTLWYNDYSCLGIPGANMWRESWRAHVGGLEELYVWREPDAGGDSMAARIASDLPDVRIIEAPPDAKDPNELWQVCGCDRERFRARMDDLLARAIPASGLKSEALSTEARQLYRKCKHLLLDPDLLKQVGSVIRLCGYAGDLTSPILVYIGLSSRHLERPMNVTVLAQSSSGKNRVVDAALELVPKDAYHLEKSGSARALIYTDVDFAHKAVIVAEADSIPEDGPAASAIRSLAADNYMSYDVVEKDGSGQFTTRHVEKLGPTGLITTTTRPLGTQMSTRMLTITVSDSQEQTRAVLMSHAASVNGGQAQVDLSAFIALQSWLAIAGVHAVTIPFAPQLARAVPVNLVRMRRDFRQMLTVIQTVALLHQCQRERDRNGSVIASLEDYRIARELLLDVFTATATGGVTQLMRDTIAALADLVGSGEGGVTVLAVATKLGLAKDTAWHRIQRLISLGYVTNLETRKGQPARLVLGDALPVDVPALPTVEELMCMCSDLQETHSTIQPESEDRIYAESEAAVEYPVEKPIQPPIQPLEEPEPDSESLNPEPPVERLNDDPQGEHTRTDVEADRVYAFALAQVLGFPSVELRRGEAIAQGSPAWEIFAKRADEAKLRIALEKLEALGNEGAGAGPE